VVQEGNTLTYEENLPDHLKQEQKVVTVIETVAYPVEE